jgi:hypothetical protein
MNSVVPPDGECPQILAGLPDETQIARDGVLSIKLFEFIAEAIQQLFELLLTYLFKADATVSFPFDN